MDPAIYTLFGIADHYQKLVLNNNQSEIDLLNNTLSEYILLQAVQDLTPEAQQQLADLDPHDGQDLYQFLEQHIPNLPQKLEEYGRTFQSTIIIQ